MYLEKQTFTIFKKKRPGNFSLSQTFQLNPTELSLSESWIPIQPIPTWGAKGYDQRTQISWLEPFAATAHQQYRWLRCNGVTNSSPKITEQKLLSFSDVLELKFHVGQCAPQNLQPTPGPKTLVTRNYHLLHTVAGFVHAIRHSPRIVTRHTGHRWHNTSTICMDMNRSGQWEAQSDQCPNKFGRKKNCSLIPCDDLRNMFAAKY